MIVILVVFAITGTTTVFVKKLIFDVIGITNETQLIIKIPVYLIVILSVYNVLLLVNGFVFGQFKFFWAFEKKFFSRFSWKRTRKSGIILKEAQ